MVWRNESDGLLLYYSSYNSGSLQLMHIPYLRRLFEEVNMYLLEFEEHKGLVSALPPEENLKAQRKDD